MGWSPGRRLAALDVLAELLGGHPAARSGRAVPWATVAALAEELDVQAALWAAVRTDTGRLPAQLADRLREFHRGNTLRNARLRNELREIIAALNGAGIEPLLIKGALRLVDGTLPQVGDRWMNDLDVLVPRGSAASATEALEGAGYEPGRVKPFSHPHEVLFVRPGGPAPIEVHVDLGEECVRRVLPRSEAWQRSTALAFGALRARAPSSTDQVLHNVLHSAVQDLNHAVGGLPLRQFVDLAGLVNAHADAIDWGMVERRMTGHGLRRVLRTHLWLAHRYAGLPALDVPWWGGDRAHALRVRGQFALGWPADVQRNLRYAFGREYLDVLYAHGGRPESLALARVRHAARLLRGDATGAVRQAVLPRN